jgi:hypothetical protein
LSVLLLAASSVANAQATRTWVSGVGDDVNPCSRTAPCKTFAGAISKTAANGTISVLDSGGFGAVTITKSITIEGDGALASVLGAGTNGITVNAGVSDIVTLRNLIIEGANTGLNGIRFLNGLSLTVENCVINRFTLKGIDFEPAGAASLFVRNTVVRNFNFGGTGGAIFIKPSGVGSASVSLTDVQLQRSVFGVRAEGNSKVSIRSSTITGNSGDGVIAFSAAGSTPTVHVDSSLVTLNGTGIRAEGGANAIVRISGSSIVNNTGASIASVGGGQIISFGDNNIGGNAPDVFPTSTVIQR